MKKLLFLPIFFFVFILLSNDNFKWINDQIKQDLESFKSNTISSKELKYYFDNLSKNGSQALYCKIRNNKIYWKKTKQTDEWRNLHIFAYFKSLRKKYYLPNTDFIIISDDGQAESKQLPVFSFAKNKHVNNVLLIQDFEMFLELSNSNKNFIKICKKISRKNPWIEKKGLAFFRGAGTGVYNPNLSDYGNDRMRVILFSSNYPELVDATFCIVFCQNMGTLLNSIGKKIESAPLENHFQYKYLLDIDGNSCTYSRCRWILLSNSVLLKLVTDNEQWYYKALKPWVNYVPIKQDISDLADNIKILKSDDALAHEIAINGNKLGKQIFTRKVIDNYMFRLLKAYSKHVKIN